MKSHGERVESMTPDGPERFVRVVLEFDAIDLGGRDVEKVNEAVIDALSAANRYGENLASWISYWDTKAPA